MITPCHYSLLVPGSYYSDNSSLLVLWCKKLLKSGIRILDLVCPYLLAVLNWIIQSLLSYGLEQYLLLMMDFVAMDDAKKNVRCRIVGAPRDTSYFEQPMSFAYAEGVLYLRIGNDVYESQEAPYRGQGIAVHCRLQNSSSLYSQDDSSKSDTLSDVCFTESEYLFWPAGTVMEEQDSGSALSTATQKLVNSEPAGSNTGNVDQAAQSKRRKAELVETFLSELDNHTS